MAGRAALDSASREIPELVVRMSGCCSYFDDLRDDAKLEIISGTCGTLQLWAEKWYNRRLQVGRADGEAKTRGEVGR